MNYSEMFKPITLGNVEIKNRFVMAPMGSTTSDENHHLTEQSYAYYEERAKGGFGLIISGYMCVSEDGYSYPNQTKICDDEAIPMLQELTGRIHMHGAKCFAQLQHSGMINDYAASGNKKIGPSSVSPWYTAEKVTEMTKADIERLVQKFTEAAVRAQKAGYDGVEVHGAHGYLVTQFLSKLTNKRSDEYGGGPEGRARFACEIIRSIRKELGPDFPISVRINAVDDVFGGNTIEDTCAIVPLLEEAGADMINVSRGVLPAGTVIAPYYYNEGFNIENARKIKACVNIPVACVGRLNDPALAESMLKSGAADFAVFGRQSIADPEFPNKVKEGRFDEIFYCTGCMQRCQGPKCDAEDSGVSCLINPFTGKEYRWNLKETTEKKNIVIVGAGVAGLEAAWILAKRGYKVTVLEKAAKAGGQILLAGVPPMKNQFAKIALTYETLAKKYGAEIRLNTEANEEVLKALKPDILIMATGANPLMLPIPGIDGEKVCTAHEILKGNKNILFSNVLIVGSGLVGCEAAEYLMGYGNTVTIVDMVKEMAMQLGAGPRKMLLRNMEEHNVKFYPEAKVQQFTEDGIVYEKDGEIHSLGGFDHVVLAMGARADRSLEEIANKVCGEIYWIGDASKAGDAKKAIFEAAKLAVEL